MRGFNLTQMTSDKTRKFMFSFQVYSFKKRKKEKNLKYKTKLHQLKVELLKIQKINNLKQRCRTKNKKIHQKIEREK